MEQNLYLMLLMEILINKRKWLISGLYRPQSINDNNFNKDFIDTFDKISTLYDNVLILGDINYDMLSEHKGAPLKNVCDIFDFVNLVKSPTCFTKGAPATLNDVILTNRSTLFEGQSICQSWWEDFPHKNIRNPIEENCTPLLSLSFFICTLQRGTVYDRSSSTSSDRSKDKEHPTYTLVF
jgi:hypothetical protein